jgi:hypothetical protein
MPDFVEQREAAYEQLLGREYSLVYHETEPETPHVDVYVFPPTDEEDYYTMTTGGMSDLRMNVPAKRGHEYDARRAELVMFADEPRLELIEVLRVLAHFPHVEQTFFEFGHTIPWRGPIVVGSSLDTILLANSTLAFEKHGEPLVLEGDPVSLLQAAAITKLECEYKLQHGANALIDRFIERGASLVFDPFRASCVAEDEPGDRFPFPADPHQGVFTTRKIMDDEKPILLVLHEEDGDWPFLPGTSVESADLVLVHFHHIVDDHPDIHVLGDLRRGWAAERASETDDWTRYPWTEGDE